MTDSPAETAADTDRAFQEWKDARLIAYALDHLANGGGGAYAVQEIREARERFMDLHSEAFDA